MEDEKRLPVRISQSFLFDLDEVFNYGLETFGQKQAENYETEIWELIDRLPSSYHLFPECKHLPTKSKIYRWIILDAHLIIYRIRKKYKCLDYCIQKGVSQKLKPQEGLKFSQIDRTAMEWESIIFLVHYNPILQF